MDQIDTQSNNASRDRIVTGNVWKTVWWLSWPSILTSLFQTANGLIDGIFVGRLGAAALSGVGLASQVMMVLFAVGISVSIGSTAIIARFVGANEPEQAEQAVRQSLLLGVAISIVSGVLAYLLGPTLIRTMGGNDASTHQGVIYLNLLLLSITPYFLMLILTGVFRGTGDMRTPLNVMVVLTAVSLIGDYLLIFGIGPFPKLGIVGAGIATSTSRIVAMILLFLYLPKSHLRNSLRGSWRPSWEWFARIIGISVPAAGQGLMRTLASMTYFSILGRTPGSMYAIAALTIGLRMEAIAFMPGSAFGIAATSMVGQNLGAKRPDRAEKAAWAATWQGVIVMGAMGLLFILFAHPIARVFTDDPKVLPQAVAYLQLNGFTEPFLALSIILTGALQGAGETRLPMLSTIVILWLIRLPLTYYLAITLGLNSWGAWAAMSGSTLLGGLATLAVFKLSKWKDIRV